MAYTYDGTAVMSGGMCRLQGIVNVTHKHALFVHCHGHKMNLILGHSVDSITEYKLLFSALSDLRQTLKSRQEDHLLLTKELKLISPSRNYQMELQQQARLFSKKSFRCYLSR